MRALTRTLLLPLLAGCWGSNAYILEGTVLEVRGDREVVVDHEAVEGLMGPMVMPFRLADAVDVPLSPGDRILARLMVEEGSSYLAKVRVTGRRQVAELAAAEGPAPVRAGEVLPRAEIPVTGGEAWVIGAGQPAPTVVTFLYTRCPIPEYCPMVVSRLQALQDAVGDAARLLAVTIDPEHDDLEVLEAFAERAGARPEVWRFGRLEGDALTELVTRAALPVVPGSGEIVHGLRLLVLDREGRLVERYDDNHWPLDRVVQQLRTGGPPAPPGSDGTMSKPLTD